MASNVQGKLGYLITFTIPDVDASYRELKDLARAVGLPTQYTPDPPAPMNAWEKGTQLGVRGVKITPPYSMITSARRQYNSEPVVRLLTRIVSRSAPMLKRHVVREAVVPQADAPDVQLSLDTVAVMTFDTATRQSTILRVTDPAGWSNGSVSQVLQDIDGKIGSLGHYSDGDKIRVKVRELLEDLCRVTVRGTGGVYFIPAGVAGAKDLLKSLRNYINGLDTHLAANAQNRPSCQVWALTRDDEALELGSYDDIKASVIDEVRIRLNALHSKVQPVLSGKARGKVADQVNEQAMAELAKITQALKAYRAALDDDLEMIGDAYHITKATVLKAIDAGVAAGE